VLVRNLHAYILFTMLTGTHSCRTKWSVSERDQYIDLEDLLPLINSREPVLVPHIDIAWKCMDDPDMKIHGGYGLRYKRADIHCPGIIADGVTNPFGKRYRMVDGSHRITKITQETDWTQSYFYIISKDEFHSYLKDYDGHN